MGKINVIKINIGRKKKFISVDSDLSIEEQVSIGSELFKNMLSCEKHNFEVSGTWFEDVRVRNDEGKLYYPSHKHYRCSICGLESKYNNL